MAQEIPRVQSLLWGLAIVGHIPLRITDGRSPRHHRLRPMDERHLRLGVKAAGVALWTWNVDTDRLTMDDIGYDLWTVPTGSPVTFEDLSANIHPADRDRVRAAFSATRGIVGPYEIDFRIMVGEEVRWISARGRGDDEGIVGRVMYGVFLDVTGRKQAEEANELLAGEMSHRVKNLIAIAGALTAMTSRSAETKEEMAHDLTHRLTALGRAHDLVRPVPGKNNEGALLGDLVSVLLTPYDDLGAFSGRIRVSVPRMAIDEAAATNLALVLHELATNSVKHGALSARGGLLDVACLVEGDEAVIVWTERGGAGFAARRRRRVRQQVAESDHDPAILGFGHLRLAAGRLDRDPEDQERAVRRRLTRVGRRSVRQNGLDFGLRRFQRPVACATPRQQAGPIDDLYAAARIANGARSLQHQGGRIQGGPLHAEDAGEGALSEFELALADPVLCLKQPEGEPLVGVVKSAATDLQIGSEIGPGHGAEKAPKERRMLDHQVAQGSAFDRERGA